MRLVRRRECWVPTAPGWALLAAIFLGGAVLVIRSINSFLCVTSPVPAQVLIVEGWLPDSALKGAIDEFKRGGYSYVMTSGGASPEVESRFQYKTWADFGAANLAKLGLETNLIVPAPTVFHLHDRTYSSAMAAKERLDTTTAVRAVNVYSVGVHARRSRLLFQKALGDQVKVGIFSHPDESYDPGNWWRSSQGVQQVIGETINYAYARVFFHPSVEKPKMTFKQTTLLAVFPGVVVAVWFFKMAKDGDRNPWWAFLVGAVSAYAGSLLAGGFIQMSGLFGFLSGLPLAAAQIVGSLAGGALVAATVRANLYADGEPTAFDVLAMWLVVAGSVLVPLLVCL